MGMGLPLDVAPDPEMEVEAHTLIVDSAHRVLADCGVLGWSTDDQERMAAYLVRAANAYPALTEALGLLRDTAENGLAAATLPVSPATHVEGLTGILRQMVASIDATLADLEAEDA